MYESAAHAFACVNLLCMFVCMYVTTVYVLACVSVSYVHISLCACTEQECTCLHVSVYSAHFCVHVWNYSTCVCMCQSTMRVCAHVWLHTFACVPVRHVRVSLCVSMKVQEDPLNVKDFSSFLWSQPVKPSRDNKRRIFVTHPPRSMYCLWEKQICCFYKNLHPHDRKEAQAAQI